MKSNLVPEQQRALSVLLENMPRWSSLFTQQQPNMSMLRTGYFAFSAQPLNSLPKGTTWLWNQSNGKTTIELDGKSSVTLQKMNTRRKRNSNSAPSLKVWLFYIQEPSHQPHLFGLWCEKGVPEETCTQLSLPMTIPSPLELKQSVSTSSINIDEVKLSDLAFLSPFIDEDLAVEFGWV